MNYYIGDDDDIDDVNHPLYGQLECVYYEDDNRDPSDNDWETENPEEHPGLYEAYEYDSEGRRTVVIKPVQLSLDDAPKPVRTRTVHNDDGQVAQMIFNHVENPAPDADPSVTNVTFAFDYDEQGNRSRVTYPSGLVKEWQYVYDNDKRLVSMLETQASGVSTPKTFKNTVYDENGMIDYILNGNGDKTDYAYDDYRLLTKEYTYSGLSEPAFAHHYAYDSRGRTKTVTTNGTGIETRTEHRAYDPETGRLDWLETPEGLINYDYDEFGALKTMEYSGDRADYKYNAHGNIRSVDMPGGRRWEYVYNVAGLKETVFIIHANARETRTHDGLGRVKTIEHKNLSTGETQFKIEYELGADGQRLGWLEYYGAEVTRWRYEYDDLGRLIRERKDDDDDGTYERDVSYTYDSDSNRASMWDADPDDGYERSRKYVYDSESQRMLEARSFNGAVIREKYGWTANGEQDWVEYYDDNGNFKSKTAYTWGPDGTLIEAAFTGGLNDGVIIYYTYDHNNELVGRKATRSGEVLEHERYLVDHQNPTGYSQRLATFEVKASGELALVSTFAWSEDFLVQRDIAWNGTVDKLPQVDALGTVRNLTYGGFEDYSNFESYRYTAFGSLTDGDRSLTDYAFTGQVADSATDLQYHRARWLQKSTATWNSSDPIWDYPSNQGNAYLYASGSPIDFCDPTGKFTKIELAIVTTELAILAYTAVRQLYLYRAKARRGGATLSNSALINTSAALVYENSGFNV